jgi:uncharacterized membrane protein
MNDTVIDLFFTLRVFVVVGFLLVLPRITRRGLLFGAYIGEASAERDAVRRLLGDWYLGCVMLMAVSFMVGFTISFSGWAVAGNLIGTVVLLLGGLVLYLRFHSRARELAPPAVAQQAKIAVAPLQAGEPEGTGLAKLALSACLATSIAVFVYALLSLEGTRSDESFAHIMFVPSLNLLISPFTALLALLTAKAKRSLRGGSGGRSVEAQDAFRATMTNVASWTALLICAFMALLSIQVIRLLHSEIDSLGLEVWLSAVAVFALILANLIRVVKSYGQGGALLETGSAEAPLTDGLADNARWAWGLFYVDRNDPSIMVESRFGLGYTFNYGNRISILIVATFLVLSLGVVTLVLVGILR